VRAARDRQRRIAGLRRGTAALRGTTLTLRGYETVRGVRPGGTVRV